MWTRCVLSLILLRVLAAPLETWANSSTDILKSESINLFKKVLTGDVAPTACEIDKKWYKEKISPERLAKHVGPLSDTNSTHSQPPFTPEEILDPTGDMRGSFCSDAEKKTSSPEEVATPGGIKSLKTLYRVYGFPVFNVGYTKAALVSCSGFVIVYATVKDQVVDYEGGCFVEYYIKRNDSWEFEDRDILTE